MKVKRFHLYALVGYSAVSLYFIFYDIEAFFLFAILSPISGLFIYTAVRKKHITLSLFTVLFFFANAISPSFFFLNRDKYTYSGWTAVKDFNFEIFNFLKIYLWVYILMFFILVFTLKLNNIPFARMQRPSYTGYAPDNLYLFNSNNNRQKRYLYSCLLMIVILILAIPLNIFMFKNQIGIVGLMPVALPFHMTGVLYYSRYFIIPSVILYLYMKSNRSLFLCMVILMYAVIGGLLSVSRSVLIMAFIPVILFAFLDRQYIRFCISVIIILISFQIISAARNFVYAYDNIIFSELFSDIGWDSVPYVIGEISGRFGGAQDNVLAYQYHFDNQISAIIKYFSAQPLMENYALELYGFNLPEDLALGIGFSLIPWLIVLADKNIFILIFLSAVISLLLFLSEKIVRNYLLFKNYFVFAAYPLSFVLVNALYNSQLKMFYFFMLISVVILYFIKNRNVFRVDHNHLMPPYRSGTAAGESEARESMSKSAISEK